MTEQARELFLQANPNERDSVDRNGEPGLIWAGLQFWLGVAESAKRGETYSAWSDRMKAEYLL